MTRILAFSDLHLGAGADHRADALSDQARILEQIASLVFERKCDLVLNAGDTFHRAKPAPAELHVFKRFCEALAALEIPMVAIGGNGMHEAAPGQRSALELFESRWVRCSRSPEVITEFAGVAVCTLPAASLGRLAASRNGGSRADLAEEAVDLLLAAARDLFAQAPDDRPRILLAHQMVSGASLPTGLPVEQVGSCVLPLWALEEIGCDAVVLGDIHRSQILQDVPFVAYCGAPMRHDFGEESNEPGVWILEVDTEGCDYEVAPLEDRRFISVDVDLAEEVSEPETEQGQGERGHTGELELLSSVGYAPSGTLPAAPTRPGSLASLDETDLIAAAIMEQVPLTDAVVRVRYRASEAQHRRVDHQALARLVADAGASRLYGGIAWQRAEERRSRAEGLDESVGPLDALGLWLDAAAVPAAEGEALRALLGEWLRSAA